MPATQFGILGDCWPSITTDGKEEGSTGAPVDGSWLGVAGEGEEELAVLPPARKLCDCADARQGHLLLLLARGQAVDLKSGRSICQITHHQSIPLCVNTAGLSK